MPLAIWTTEDGRNIKLKDMADRHIQNAINFMKKKATKEVASILKNFSNKKEFQTRLNSEINSCIAYRRAKIKMLMEEQKIRERDSVPPWDRV